MKRLVKKHWPIFLIVAAEVVALIAVNLYKSNLIPQLDAMLGIGGTIVAWIIGVMDNAVLEVSMTTRRTPTDFRTAPVGLGIAPTYEIVIQYCRQGYPRTRRRLSHIIRPQYLPLPVLVTEAIPEIKDLSLPKEGDHIKIWGITRFDEPHNWWELHPVIGWEKVQ